MAREETASSRPSLDEEIDRFRFEDEERPASVPGPEGETGDHSSVHEPAVDVTCLDTTSEEDMASNKQGRGLKDLLAGRAKGGTSKGAPKAKVPHSLPPPPVDLGLKVIPDLKKKRPIVNSEEGEISQQKGTKQQKTGKEPKDKRSSSVDSRKD